MNEAWLTLPATSYAPHAPVRQRRALRDLVLVIGASAATFLLSSAFQLREWLTDITRPLERYQIDELPLTFAVLAVSLAWFAWRRWRHAEEELQLRVAAQQALVAHEAQYRTLFMENLAGTALASAQGEILLCNPAFIRMLGLEHASQARGRNFGQFYADKDLWQKHQQALAAGRKLEIGVLELRGASGIEVKAIACVQPHRSPGVSAGLLVFLADISELQIMQRELADALAENRLLSQKYLMVQEDERRNLARELHDELGQCLNAIKLDAVVIRDMVQGRQPEIEVSAKAIVELSGHVYEVVRGIMQRLRPAALDALGLRDAVEHLLGQWRRGNPGVDCRFVAGGDLSDLDEMLNITVYRLAQECLTNIAKHARAAHVTVSLERRDPHELLVAVADDGCGLDPAAKRTGLGLIGLRERVEALSGRLHLATEPGKGLTVSAVLPVTAQH